MKLRFFAGRSFLTGIFLSALALLCVFFLTARAGAAAGTNQQINFQGRLLNSQGAVVPDGYYNMEFKIYQDGDGQSVGDTTGSPAGSLKWTEDYLNASSQGVRVVNGFLSVQLGSITPFGSNIDWNQDTLWLSVNIGGTGGSCSPFSTCSPDGEMVPMKRLSSTPYALNSSYLGGLSSAQFVQLAQGLQTDASGNASIAINKTGSGDLLDLQSGGSDALTINNSGDINLGANGDHTVSVAMAASDVAGKSLTVAAGAAGSGGSALAGGDLVLQGGAGGGTNGVGGNITIDAGAGNGTGVDGNISIGTNHAADIILGKSGTLVGIGSAPSVGDGVLQVAGALTINSNYSSAISFTTPKGVSVPTAINIPLYDPGSFGQILAFGLPSGADYRARAISVFDARTSAHQPSIAVLSPDESNIFGLSWEGSDTTSYLKTTAGDIRVRSGTTDSLALLATGETVALNQLQGGGIGKTALELTDTGANTGLTIGDGTSTTNLYRSATGVLTTDGSLTIGADALIQGNQLAFGTGATLLASSSTNSLELLGARLFPVGSTISDPAYCSATNTDNYCRFQERTDGLLEWGAGSTPVDTNLYRSTAGTLQTDDNLGIGGNISFTNDTDHTISVATAGSGIAGKSLTLYGGSAGAGGSTLAGGAVVIQGGSGGGTNGNGGNVNISGGTGAGSGVSGLVVLSTPTFSTTANDPNCFAGGALVASSCTIAASSVDSSSAILVGFSQSGQTATLPNPTLSTAGRVIYITAAYGSSDFTLSVNGGGTGNEIAMRQNTSATMIWSGSKWTAAGASSSTTLQAAYDNTLVSAGGAELVVSHTSSTNGLTIRDSSTNPVSGPLVSVQSSSAAQLFSVNSNVAEYSSDGGAETQGGSSTTFPASTWAASGSANVSRYTTVGDYVATGIASAQTTTTASAGAGIKDTLSEALTANMHYNVSFSARLDSGTFTDMSVDYSADGTTSTVNCTTSKAILTSIWTKVNCSFAAPASGITSSNAILITQAGAAAHTFYVDNLSVTIAADYNYATDGGVDDGDNFSTNWSFVDGGSASGSVTRNTTDGNDASDSAGVTLTSGAANAGLRDKLAINPLTNTLYRVTVYAKLGSGTFTDFKVRYSRDGSTGASGNYVDCVDYNTETVVTTGWTEITCYLTTDGTAATNPYVNFVEGSSTARTFYVDTFSMTLSTDTTPNVQIGGGTGGGPVTLFTLDRGASAPIAVNNDAFLGSMYYDTTLGELQCYEADGWGACGASPDNIITISPEYNNAVMHGPSNGDPPGIGTMTSDICSDTLGINDADDTSGDHVCGTDETYNYYKWTSPQATNQTYAIYVTYKLPDTFKDFASGSTSIMGRTDDGPSGGGATVQYKVFRNSSSGLTPCGPAVSVSSGTVSSWQTGLATGAADPSTCGFAPGDSIVFEIDMSANKDAKAYVSNLGFTFSNK